MGIIIGKGGSRINEIRQLSGANIKIARKEDDKHSGADNAGASGDVSMDVNDNSEPSSSSGLFTWNVGGYLNLLLPQHLILYSNVEYCNT